MITFESITVKNFLSVGNSEIIVKLNEHSTTLLSGGNGAGKTAVIIDGICYALYGKPYRSINKPALINSINGKQLLATIAFTIGKKKYTIRRGMKPGIFEIIEDGKLINQDPNVKDYQQVLENQILKMNFRAFTQVVVLGAGYHVPFMKLQAAQRREFVEDLLDIKVFSSMFSLLKDKMKITKDEIKDCEVEIKSMREKILLQESFIKKQQKDRSESVTKLQEENEALGAEIDELEKKIDSHLSKISELKTDEDKFSKMLEEMSELRVEKKNIEKQIAGHLSEKQFYESIDECPKCRQSISDDHRLHIVVSTDETIEKLRIRVDELTSRTSILSSKYSRWDEILVEISDLNKEISSLNREISSRNGSIQANKKRIEPLIGSSVSIDEEKDKLREAAKSLVARDKMKKELLEKAQYETAMYAMLQDTGIKSKIVKQYIPVLNKIVNKYLDALEFFVSFNLDENFNEVVKSRHRDTFTYDNFSEGQKLRISFALVLTWRDIARLKNSVNTNLLVLDEILDGSSDSDGVDAIIDLLKGMSNTNVFVVSHRDNIASKFDSVINVKLKNNFTVHE